MSSTNTVNFAGIPDYTALAQAYGYGNPQFAIQAQQRKSSGLSNAVKAGAVGTVGAGVALWGFNPSCLTPVDKNGNLFSEYLYALEDTAKIQKGIDEAGFKAAKTALDGKITVNTAEDWQAIQKFIETGKLSEKASEVEKNFSNMIKTKASTIGQELKTKWQAMNGQSFETKLTEINKILKNHNLAEISGTGKDAHKALNKVMNGLLTGKGENYTSLHESLVKEYKTLTSQADSASKIAQWKTAVGLGANGAKEASILHAEAYLASLNRSKNFFEALPKTEEGILKFLEEKAANKAKLSTLKGDELIAFKDKLKNGAKKLLEMRKAQLNGGTFTSVSGKATTFTKLSKRITKQEGVVKEIKDGLQKKFGSFFDSSRGTLKNGAPDKLAKAFKGFKWGTIAKRAGIIGGIAALGGWLLLKEA